MSKSDKGKNVSSDAGKASGEKDKRKAAERSEKTQKKKVSRSVELEAKPPLKVSSEAGLKKRTKKRKAAENPEISKEAELLSGESAAEATDEAGVETLSPLFRRLADPVLPDLPRENRARLQMQSPERLYFYWSVKTNPYKTLSRALGGSTGSYALVARLINLSNGAEELYAVEPEGNWWFNAEPNCEYRAEIGFYAPNRPYFRIVFSNSVITPRKKPSRRRDYVPAFNIAAHQFAAVLDASGYKRDAFEVAIAGDDMDSAKTATLDAYSRFAGGNWDGLSEFDDEELRFVLIALASGYSLEEIRDEIRPALYLMLKSRRESLTAEDALAALEQNFDVFSEESFELEETGESVVGASLINFPRKMRKRAVPRKILSRLPRFETISSSG